MKKQKRLSDKDKIEVVRLYTEDLKTCSFIAKIYKVSVNAIISILKVRKIPIRNDQSILQRKYTINENYFDTIDTEDKAYFLGLLYADGCNNTKNNTVCISLKEDDKEILEKFNLAINSSRPIKYIITKKEDGWNRKNQYKLSLSSRHLSESLVRLGCFKNKTYTLLFPTKEQVPKYLLKHFIRGYIDGDGCLSLYKLKKTGHIKTNINITSTLNFCIELSNFLDSIKINSYINQRRKTSKSKTLWISGRRQCLKFLNYIYSDSTIYLKRKHDIYIKIIKSYNKGD